MPHPVVGSPLGLALGDRGLLPLPDALPGDGAGVVAGGTYTLPHRMLDTLTGERFEATLPLRALDQAENVVRCEILDWN